MKRHSNEDNDEYSKKNTVNICNSIMQINKAMYMTRYLPVHPASHMHIRLGSKQRIPLPLQTSIFRVVDKNKEQFIRRHTALQKSTKFQGIY